jgi:hypothetical protein
MDGYRNPDSSGANRRTSKGATRLRSFASRCRPAISAAILALGLAACQTRAPTEQDAARSIPAALLCDDGAPVAGVGSFDPANHVVMADSSGGPVEIHLDGSTTSWNGSVSNQFKKIFGAFAEWRARQRSLDEPGRILIFANGGLNSSAFSIERARVQTPCMLRAGYFPMFLVLQTGQYDSYWEGTSRIRDGQPTSSIKPTLALDILGDIGEGIARMPARLIEQIVRQIDALTGDAEGDSPEAVAEFRELGVNVTFEGADGGGPTFGDAALGLAATPLKPLTIPLVDAMGDAAWTNMVRRALSALRHPDEFAGSRDPALLDRYPRGTGAFSMLFAELTRCAAHDEECLDTAMATAMADTEITVIAHSLGTIAAGELIRSYPDLPYGRIVYMAAACSTRQFLDTVAPVLAARPSIEFHNLSLHPRADLGDTYGFGTAPTGSLLEWIDSMYADVPTMLDRTFGKWRNVAAAVHVFPDDILDQMTFRVFGFREADPDRNDPGDPVSHGDFTLAEMHYWLPDFWGVVDRPPATASN